MYLGTKYFIQKYCLCTTLTSTTLVRYTPQIDIIHLNFRAGELSKAMKQSRRGTIN
jgi:hypothetical protein